jgi:5'(3')-deoxyribonucleotidase
LVNFDKGYYELTGVEVHHADTQGNDAFWKLFMLGLKKQNRTELDYWSKLEWLPDGQELWNYIKKYNPYILTAPSKDLQSRQGKTNWVNNHLTGFKKILFAKAADKPRFASKNHILIDDRADTINSWIDKGGVGIFHVDAKTTIDRLQKIGL